MVTGKGPVRAMLIPSSVAIGYVCGHYAVTGWASLPPADTTNWLPIFGLAAAAGGAALPLLPHPPVRAMAAGFISIVAMRLLLHPLFEHAWPDGRGWVWVLGLSIAVVLLSGRIEALSRRSTTRFETPLLLVTTCAGCSAAISLSGSLLLGQLTAVLGAALSGMLLLGWRGPANRESASLVFSLLYIALLACGYFFSGLPAGSALLLGAASSMALIPIPFSLPLGIFAARFLLICVPLVIAILLASGTAR